MQMFNPPHPGEILREDCIKPLNLTVTEVAKKLNISRNTLSNIINEKAGISPAMALKLAKAFETTPDSWLNMQIAYDLWHATNNTDLSQVEIIHKAG